MNDVFQYAQISEKILNTIDLPAGTLYPDLAKINESLSERLNLPNLEIKVENTKWLLKEEIDFLVDDDIYQLSFSMLPLEGVINFFMNTNEISKITTWAMTKNEKAKPFSSEILQEGFYHYLVLEAMDAIDQDSILQGFSLKILSNAKETSAPSLCVDIKITYQTRSAHAKLIISQKIVKNWREAFFKESNNLVSKIAKSAAFTLSINVGKIALSHATLNTLSEGDFIILDRSYYDPKTHQGSVLLTFNNDLIYQGKIKQNNITILDFSELKEDHMEETQETIPVKEVPLAIQVEMGEIQMNLEKLMSLTPGEVIETTINPNDNVSLVLNNKTIAKGELVKVGEAIGVRILEIG